MGPVRGMLHRSRTETPGPPRHRHDDDPRAIQNGRGLADLILDLVREPQRCARYHDEHVPNQAARERGPRPSRGTLRPLFHGRKESARRQRGRA
jgi:hypothetical protein